MGLFLVGLSKLAFGLLVGAIGVTASARVVKRAVGLPDLASSIRQHNSAVGLCLAAAILAMGLSVVSLLIRAGVIVVGIKLFVRLTPDIDEMEEIGSGNVASAVVVFATITVLALLARDGVDTLLTSFLPMPTLGRDGPA
ncbi:MAG: DUF350 domain-containing protein [Pseudomonadales bacterium]